MGESVDISQFSIYILCSYPKGVLSPPINGKKKLMAVVEVAATQLVGNATNNKIELVSPKQLIQLLIILIATSFFLCNCCC